MTAIVLTGPEWLVEMFDGNINSTNTAKIEVLRTADNVPYIGKEILTDPTYQDGLNTIVNGKEVWKWLEEIEIEIEEGTE